MVTLTDNDVKILKFIKRHQPVSIKDIECAMSEVSSVKYRVKELSAGALALRLRILRTSKKITKMSKTKRPDSQM